MLPDLSIIAAGVLWLGMLFGAAVLGDRRPQLFARHWSHIYALSLAVYCTSWTFYGTVTQASRSGWWLPPTFVGTILIYVFGIGLLMRLVSIARAHNSSSLADLVAIRLGRSPMLAALVTAVAVIGIVPYIALQLKSVAMSYGLLARRQDLAAPAWQDSALWVALAMAVFAMLFGARRASAAAHNRGLVLAMAFESVLKLIAMLALGALVWFGLEIPFDATALPPAANGSAGFTTLILLGALAVFTLPHQFHAGVVECRDAAHVRTARWLFPMYMLLIALPILPLARAGDALLRPSGVPSDLYVLALPLAQGQHILALLAFLGGLSAATGMVVVATLALSLMIGNHWIAPLRVRAGWGRALTGDLRGEVLMQRRLIILAVVLLAWAYSRVLVASEALADIGAVSFSALSAIAPGVLVAVYRPQVGARAVGAGMVAGTLVWLYALMLPVIGADSLAWVTDGPFGVSWLAPDRLLGLDDWSRLARAVVLSLAANLAVIALVASSRYAHATKTGQRGRVEVGDLRALSLRFLPEEQVRMLFVGADGSASASEALVAAIEHELAAVIGASSARLLLTVARRERTVELEAVVDIVGETSQDLRFNQRVLEAALENMSQGISVVDRDLGLVAWNRPYAQLFGYPDELLRVGVPVADLLRWNVARGLGGGESVADEVRKRINHMRAGTPYVAERRFPGGQGERVVEIRGNPMPGGGFVATFTDVTEFRSNEAELMRVAETLEQRVSARTAELDSARQEAEKANRAKSRFLAAVSHDLAQPLNAAHLFAHALSQRLRHVEYRESIDNIDGALTSAENLLAGLLDISRLDAGRTRASIEAFPMQEWLAGLAAEFRVLADERGLQLHSVASRAWVSSDPQLLRRIVQNFLANAIRHARTGRILLGCRRRGRNLSIEVWDTGPGIAQSDRELIFEEFRRLGHSGEGLGLGLAIADRIARLLDHRLRMQSRIGHGTMFAIEVPMAAPMNLPPPRAAANEPSLPRRRLLVVDNDPAVLRAMQALLSGWQAEVHAAETPAQARQLFAAHGADILLLDYHLDDQVSGLELRDSLGASARKIPCVIITADHGRTVADAVAEAGCELLHKPLKPLALRSLVARLIARSAA
ncbi:NahK/ErcS family hybrid sensor histidine kinase/response regulator [Dokdonella sp.]|uniref:hybrid sensor histidine kinase/response regulator n=1 Tax=Dokdonella sp. TaxID=2291710 RepID=UPI002D1FA470|nr:NahK/ErcS family hybrid sensor histidine kinase/response regulator [Dokdonella sp.]